MADQENDKLANADSPGQADSTPRIDYVFPATGFNNLTTTVTVGGENLTPTNVTDVLVGTERCLVRYSNNGDRLTLVLTPQNPRPEGPVDVRTEPAPAATDPGGYTYLKPVVGYRAFVKRSLGQATWRGAPYTVFQKRVPGKTDYCLDLVNEQGHPLIGAITGRKGVSDAPNADRDPGTVFKVIVAAMLDEKKIVLLDPDPAVQNQTDNQYPRGGDGPGVIWMTEQVAMPFNLKIGPWRRGYARLYWSTIPGVYDSQYRLTGYRVFRKPAIESEWRRGSRWYQDVPLSEYNSGSIEVPALGGFVYTILPRGIWLNSPQENPPEIVFGANARGVPFPDDQSNMVVAYDAPKLAVQFPPAYGQVSAVQGSIGSASIAAFFRNMQVATSPYGLIYQWQKTTDRGKTWGNLTDNWVSGVDTPVLTFGVGGAPVPAAKTGSDYVDDTWYRLQATNSTGFSEHSSPVRLAVLNSERAPALIRQWPAAGQYVDVPLLDGNAYIPDKEKIESVKQVYLSTLFNLFQGTTGDYSWGWNKDNAMGPFPHGGGWGQIGGDGSRTLYFGTHPSRGPDSRDDGWYRVQVKVGSGNQTFYEYSAPVYADIGNIKRKSSSIYGYTRVSWQYPSWGQSISVPMDSQDWVAIAAYPPIAHEDYYTLTWQKSKDGITGWTSLSESSGNGFPLDTDVRGRSSTVLQFVPNGTIDQYRQRVEGWYRLNAQIMEHSTSTAYANGNFFGSVVGLRFTPRAPCYSAPVQVIVIASGKPEMLNQSQGVFGAVTGSIGAVSIGAYFSNMEGVTSGYWWEYHSNIGRPSTVPPPDRGWVDLLPPAQTGTSISGVGTPTLTFGVKGATVQDWNTGWYRVTARNSYGTATSKPMHVTIQDKGLFRPTSVSALSERSGPAMGGTTLTITGDGFLGTSSVTFGGTEAWRIVVQESGQTMTVRTPAHAAGTVDVTIVAAGGQTTKKSGFTFT